MEISPRARYTATLVVSVLAVVLMLWGIADLDTTEAPTWLASQWPPLPR